MLLILYKKYIRRNSQEFAPTTYNLQPTTNNIKKIDLQLSQNYGYYIY